MEFVIPARDEADRIGVIVAALRETLATAARIIVVDNLSRDSTSQVARDFGADEVITAAPVGKGFAVMAGLAACVGRFAFVCDADVRGFDPILALFLAQRAELLRVPLARMMLDRSTAEAPVTTLVARPLLDHMGINGVREPLGGLVVIDRHWVQRLHLPGGWGFDVALTIQARRAGFDVPEVHAPGVTHRTRELDAYALMASDVIASILQQTGMLTWSHADCTACSGAITRCVRSLEGARSDCQSNDSET